MNKSTLSLHTAAATLAMFASASVLSQNLILEEIIVTATKRVVGLQEVPIAISVMSGAEISEKGLTKMEDLAMYMPNVHVAEASAGTQMFIRGIGSGVNYGFEQSVGTFVDGVYFGRGRSARGKFLDIERVEVLKGPQSTLFGKNTVAGALNITTAQPTEEFEGYVSAGYTTELEAMTITSMVSGPLSDTVRGRLAVRAYDDKGYVENLAANGVDGPQNESVYVRGTLAIDLNEDWTATIKAENGYVDIIGRQELISETNAATGPSAALYGSPLGSTNFAAGFGYTTYEQNVDDLPLFDDTESNIFQVTLDGTFAEHGVKIVLASTDYEFTNSLDSDYSPLKLLNRGRNEEHEQLSTEFIISSPSDDKFEYLAGGFYQQEDLSNARYTHVDMSAVGPLQAGVFGQLNTANPALGGASFAGMFLGGNLVPATDSGILDATARSFFSQDAESWSVFAEGTYNLSDTLRVTAGLRYSEDEKEMSKRGTVGYIDPTAAASTLVPAQLAAVYGSALKLATVHSYTRDRKEDHVTGHVNVQWDMTNDAMVYLELGNGYKAGGFDEDNGMGRQVETLNGVSDDLADFEDESVDTIEIGAKINLADGRGRLNIAAFSSTYEDVQVSTFDGNAGFVVGNAAESEVQGIEADVLYRLTEELTLNGAFAYLDATYKSFPGAGCTNAQSIATPTGCVQDLTGKPLQFAPEHTANVGVTYETELSSGLLLSAGLDYNWTDDVVVSADLDDNLVQKSYGKLNARISLAGNDQWQVSLVGKNITDEATFMWGNDIPLGSLGFKGSYFKLIDPPRTVELSARMNF
ncbi:MAG: TonB-dependent receptor [Pseudomonadales bacterium]|jgi:iron complex outermembrane receptor protein|tara:strand:- start:646 stop:3072 length:2427 start_codon:yes stop_codon:yes gene_type:complete